VLSIRAIISASAATHRVDRLGADEAVSEPVASQHDRFVMSAGCIAVRLHRAVADHYSAVRALLGADHAT
jgi:hypothetical protein